MAEDILLESEILHLVKPGDLNHHGTLFAGQMASWLVEAGFITAARLCGKPADIVCVKIDEMIFKKPINNGDVIEIKSRIAYLGSTSITVYSQIFRKPEKAPLVTNIATFVTVTHDNKPYPHGYKLPEEYIARNREIYDEALRMRKNR